MRLALRLARRGFGTTSPNPMVGAVLVRGSRVIGQGWHRQAGGAHAEIEALADAGRRGLSVRNATLYVTLEPCSTHGRTPPCTEAIRAAGLRKVIVGATDPNPQHGGGGFELLRQAGIAVATGILGEECERLNEAFNHWIVRRSPLVTVKAAMTLDGKIATASGESKWITGEPARRFAMRLRQGSDAILVGINTVLLDDPSLTVRGISARVPADNRQPRRIILDSRGRTPMTAKVVSDPFASLTTIVVGEAAPKQRVERLSRQVRVLVCPAAASSRDGTGIALPWLLKRLGGENVTSLLVEGGGEVNASFLLSGLAHRVAFFYAPKILGGRQSRHGVAGEGAAKLSEAISLYEVRWRRLGADLLMLAKIC